MKTDIVKIDGLFVVKTGRVLVYECQTEEEYMDPVYMDEVLDVCSGKLYAMEYGHIYPRGYPDDVYETKQIVYKRGHKSNSHNKQLYRQRRINNPFDDLPF